MVLKNTKDSTFDIRDLTIVILSHNCLFLSVSVQMKICKEKFANLCQTETRDCKVHFVGKITFVPLW